MCFFLSPLYFKSVALLRKFFATRCRSLYCAAFDRKNNWTFIRYICGYFFGVLLAVLFWKLFVTNFNLSVNLNFVILIGLIVIIGLGFVFSTAIKCVALLSCVGIFGSSGRSFLRAMGFAFIISGPIASLSSNGQEIIRVFSCSTILTYNLTKTRFDLMTKPFQNTLSTMKDDIHEVERIFDSMDAFIEPIRGEIEGEDTVSDSSLNSSTSRREIDNGKTSKAQQFQQHYSNKMKSRCKQQLKQGEHRCQEAFEGARNKCMQKLPHIVNYLLCWPFSIDFVCSINIFGNPDEEGGICDPGGAIDSGLGEAYFNLQQTEEKLLKNASNVKVSYSVINIQESPEFRAAEATAKIVISEFSEKKSVFDEIMRIMQRILSLAFLKVIYHSIGYRRKYLRRIDFDNMYISEYFKKIESRRIIQNQRTLLPLKKYEQTSLIDLSNNCARTKEESKSTTYQLLKFFLELIIAILFLVLDYVLASLLLIIAEKSQISYRQEGVHNISFHINGTGLMAKFLRSTLRNFNMHENISTYLTNEACLPKPNILARSFYVKLAALYIGIVVLIYNSALFLRFRRLICGYFYRKREKQRILHLYNNLLKQRHVLFETMYRNVKEDLSQQLIQMRLNIILKIRFKYPKQFEWLKCLRIARLQCLICKEVEEPARDNDFRSCNKPKCPFVYCSECWRDIGEMCPACNRDHSHEDLLKNIRDSFVIHNNNEND